MRTFIFLILCIGLTLDLSAQKTQKEINEVVDDWHQAAAEANYEDYFSLMTADAIFIGTDPTENWERKDFEAYAKPHFDKGKTWSFTSLERHIFIEKEIAWFDELLQTQMGICRGSGIIEKTKEGWKIKHYVLSMTIPNDQVATVVQLKKDFEEKFIKNIKTTP